MYNGLAQMPNNIYRAVIYIRLSEADEGKSYESESESITNQRNLLMNDLDLVVGDDFVVFSNITKAGKSEVYEKIERIV